jgi:hypothetical protein
VAAYFIFSNFPELRRIAAARSVPVRNFVKSRLSATVEAAFRHFIVKTRSLRDGRQNSEGDKRLKRRVRSAALGEGSSKTEDEVGHRGTSQVRPSGALVGNDDGPSDRAQTRERTSIPLWSRF